MKAGKGIGLIIIGILLFILGFLYGRERAIHYPPKIEKEKISIERVGEPVYRQARKESKLKKESELKEKFFTLQVGSFEKKEHAENLFQKLRKKGYPVFLKRVDLKEKGIWYRVKVGEYPTKVEAEKFKEKLEKEEGLKESLIIPF